MSEYEYVKLAICTGRDFEVGDFWVRRGADPTSDDPQGFITKKDHRLWWVDQGLKCNSDLNGTWDQGLDYYRKVKKSPPPTAEELQAAYQTLKEWTT